MKTMQDTLRLNAESTDRDMQTKVDETQLSIVVIGSYRRDFTAILEFCRHLEKRGHVVLQPPVSSEIVGETSGFVWLSTDPADHVADVQRHVFQQIDKSDLVVLHCPDGRVGTSAALEVGYALKAGVAVVPTEYPKDETLRALLCDISPATRLRLGLPTLPELTSENQRDDD